MERLNTDRSLAPLVAQFVPLKMETDGDKWGAWAGKYSHEGNGIPIIYVVRADGTKLYGKSGGLGDQLPQFLALQLSSAGKILSSAQLAQVQSAVDDAKQALEAGDKFTAIKRLDSLKKLGTTGQLGSFAAPALAADELVAQLTEEGKSALSAAKEQLAGEDKFAGIMAVLTANRIYGSLPALKKELGAAERELSKDAALRELLPQAQAIDKALSQISTKGGKQAAAEALARVVARFPDTPAAAAAQAKIAELGVEVAAASPAAEAGSDSDSGQFRIWTDVTGKFRIEAELVEVTETEVKLRRKDNGKTVSVARDKLSDEDQKFLEQR